MNSLLCDESKEPRLCNIYLRNGRSGEANGKNFVVNIVAEDHIMCPLGYRGFWIVSLSVFHSISVQIRIGNLKDVRPLPMSFVLIGIKLTVKTSNSGRAIERKLPDEIRRFTGVSPTAKINRTLTFAENDDYITLWISPELKRNNVGVYHRDMEISARSSCWPDKRFRVYYIAELA